MTSLLKSPIAKKVLAAVAVKEIVERIQEVRAPKKSFVRRNAGKLALLALAGGEFVVWQRSRVGIENNFGQSSVQPRRDPAIEPGERLEAPIRVDQASDSTNTPTPAGR